MFYDKVHTHFRLSSKENEELYTIYKYHTYVSAFVFVLFINFKRFLSVPEAS